MCLRKGLTGVVQGVSRKRRFLARFQDGCDKDLTLNELTIMAVEKILVTEEDKVPTISVITNETIDLEKGCYRGVYVFLNFKREDRVDGDEE